MAAEQVQIRRDSNTNLTATTPADGELGYDQTNKRIVIGDGTKAGGAPIPSWVDLQGQKFTYATTTGSANAQTLTLASYLQPAAYAAGQRFAFIAGYTNTGATTLTVASLTAKTIKKVDSGSLADLAAGDITANRPYDVMYDGTYFVLMNVSAAAITPASFADAAAGNYITAVAYADSTNNPPGTSYIKVAEIKAPRAGTYRVRIRVNRDTGAIYGRAYVNGGAAGTEKSVSGAGYQYQNDDIAVNAGDLVQLFAKGGSAADEWNDSTVNAIGIALCELNPIVGGVEYNYEDDWI